ncbi:MAG: ABC transporter permease [Oscillospiraceae bacterium]
MLESALTIIGAVIAIASVIWFAILWVYSIVKYRKLPIKDEEIIFVWEEVENKLFKKSHHHCDNH